jgi:ABC-2 type transport system permease protein
MNKFLTLIRRDMADNRGALIITPLVIAAILFTVTFFASLAGQARFGFNPEEFAREAAAEFKAEVEAYGKNVTVTRDAQGRMVVTSPDGQTKTIDKALSEKSLKGLAVALPAGTGIAATLPLFVAAIAILFVLAGGLHDERKDRTILFWKSMPVSDLQTVGAKITSIVGVGFLAAFATMVVLHLALTTVAVLTLGNVGVGQVSLGPVLLNASKMWVILGFALLMYIGWALPVYGWVTMVSAWAPKMPFVAAFAPLVVIPLAYMAVAFTKNEDDKVLQVLWDPASRLIGEPVFSGLGRVLERSTEQVPQIPVAEAVAHLGRNLTQPMFWVGLLIAAGFIYAASEIRRRRAL